MGMERCAGPWTNLQLEMLFWFKFCVCTTLVLLMLLLPVPKESEKKDWLILVFIKKGYEFVFPILTVNQI